MDPLCRYSGNKLLVGGLDVLVGHLDGALREGAEWYTHLLLGPAQVQGAVDEEHVKVGAHGLGEDLPPQVEHHLCFALKLLDVLQLGTVDGHQELPEGRDQLFWNSKDIR